MEFWDVDQVFCISDEIFSFNAPDLEASGGPDATLSSFLYFQKHPSNPICLLRCEKSKFRHSKGLFESLLSPTTPDARDTFPSRAKRPLPLGGNLQKKKVPQSLPFSRKQSLPSLIAFYASSRDREIESSNELSLSRARDTDHVMTGAATRPICARASTESDVAGGGVTRDPQITPRPPLLERGAGFWSCITLKVRPSSINRCLLSCRPGS